MDETTIRDEAIDDSLALLTPYPSALLAVSGGPDSVALMLAVAGWRDRNARRIAVATVDHGLRAESRAEAEQVARWASRLGFAHHLLVWEGEKPAARLQERARGARYALLAECARRIGAAAIVTAHHADDQAETILFRLTRGSGVAGLAGMAPASSCDGTALLRPFLHLPKDRLIALCERAGQAFFRDPSNENTQFARPRLRNLAPLLAAEGLGRESLLRLGARAAEANAALDHYAAALFARALIADDSLSLDADIVRGAPPAVLQRVLALAIARLKPDRTPTKLESVANLAPALRLDRLESAAKRVGRALADETPLRLTLANAVIDCTKRGIAIYPAPQRRNG